MKPKSFAPWLVALVCLGPFLGALLLYYGPWGIDWLPQLPGSRQLLSRPVSLPEPWRAPAAQTGGAPAWQLIYARTTPCEPQCVQHLGRLVQVQLALGRDQDRVRRVFWHVGAPTQWNDAGLTALSLEEPAGLGVLEALGAEPLETGRVYVADPRGAVILSYPPDVEQKELLRDLKRLLAGADS